MKKLTTTAALALALAVLAACTEDTSGSGGQSAEDRERDATTEGMGRMTASQQVPVFDFSQERQTLIDVETARAEGTHGTATVWTLDGTLLWWCPTVGAPIPSTYQLSNPYEAEWRSGHGGVDASAVTARAEPTGVYTGDSAATWVKCTDDAGTPFVMYEEANVRWTSGVVDGLPADRRARVDEITFDFTRGEAP